jgi:hypothetical protein
MSSVKEPHFLIKNELKFIKDHKWITSSSDYHKLFSDGSDYKIRGEASAFYLFYHQTAIPAIKKTTKLPPYIIIILRNPVQRLISAYKHMVRANIDEKLSFEEIVYLEEDQRHINHPMMYYKSMGRYADMVIDYIQNFDKVKVLIYEEFFTEINTNITDVWNFLGVSEKTDINYDEKLNVKNFQWKSKGIQKLFISNNVIKKSLVNFLPVLGKDSIKKRIKSLVTKPISLSITDEHIRYLLNYYDDDVHRLSEILGKDLSHWQKSETIRWK